MKTRSQSNADAGFDGIGINTNEIPQLERIDQSISALLAFDAETRERTGNHIGVPICSAHPVPHVYTERTPIMTTMHIVDATTPTPHAAPIVIHLGTGPGTTKCGASGNVYGSSDQTRVTCPACRDAART